VVAGAPGLYVLGLPMLRRRKSSFIHGAEDDARDIVDHLAGYLGGAATADRATRVARPPSDRFAPRGGPA
jgi:putative flavoprotein involved in K+ transport